MFIPHKYENGIQPWEYLQAAAGSYKCGQAVSVTGGKVTPIAAALKTTPPYICMADVTVDDGHAVPVIRTNHEIVFETTLSAEAAAAAVGSMLEVSAGGLQVDAAAAGTFEVTDIEATAAGGTVYGRFK